jgi:transposase
MRKGPLAMSVTMIGLDTAKTTFHVHGVNEAGKALLRRKLRRSELIAFFEAQPACTVVFEACGAAHHWGRVLIGLGHTVKLIPPEAARPFVKAGRKNDAADAAALCEAARRPEVKFVPVKGLDQQAMLALHTARALLVKQQTMLANALRSLVAGFGVVAPLGLGKLGDLVAQVEASLPEVARQALGVLQDQFQAARDAAAELEAVVVAHARQDETARRLATIPGVGPITASLIAATVVDIGLFRSARHFAAWLGLVPRQHSTGGKARLGRITKAGNEQIRTLLVLGATSMVRRAERWNSAAGAWVRGVLARRPARLATVALANKMARMAWALMAHEKDYHPFGHAPAATVAA